MALLKKISLLLIVCACVFTVLFVVIVQLQQHELDKHRISVNEAKTVVERFAALSDWESGEIVLHDKLYNLHNKVEAYLFTYWVSERYARYIVVSAVKTMSPVLEYSDNEPLAKANPSDQGFYFKPNIVYAKSRAALVAKRWYVAPLILPYFMEWNIHQKVDRNKHKWEHYLG